MGVGWRDPGRENQCSGCRTVLANLMVSHFWPWVLHRLRGALQANSNCLEVVTVSQVMATVTMSPEMNTRHMQA